MVKQIVPKRGDLVWLNFDPTKGSEQAGTRPAIVVSEERFNASGLAVFCPITSQVKGFNTEVPLPSSSKIKGVILTNQIHTKDWRVRGIRIVENINKETLEAVIVRIKLILGTF